MKKLILIFLCLLVFVGCDTADIKVVNENGIAYFYESTITPKIFLNGDEDKEVEDVCFFGNLITAIENKPIVSDICECDVLYHVTIRNYSFAFHDHGIAIFESLDGCIKAKKVVGFVECDAQTMEKLFIPLRSTR